MISLLLVNNSVSSAIKQLRQTVVSNMRGPWSLPLPGDTVTDEMFPHLSEEGQERMTTNICLACWGM